MSPTEVDLLWEMEGPHENDNFEISLMFAQKREAVPNYHNKVINLKTGVVQTKPGHFKFRLQNLKPRFRYSVKMASFIPDKTYSDVAPLFNFQMPPEPVAGIEALQTGADFISIGWIKGKDNDEYDVTYDCVNRERKGYAVPDLGQLTLWRPVRQSRGTIRKP